METSNVNNATSTSSSQPVTEKETTITSDFETFLKLLTVQLENQDPLSPLQSEEFAVQLATFSSVEQQVLTNDLLKGMIASSSRSQISDYAAWVGMDALSAAPAAFNGDPISIRADLPSDIDAASFVVLDEDGQEVLRTAVAPNTTEFTWDGSGNAGTIVPEGNYSFKFETSKEASFVEAVPGMTYSRIQEARLDGGAVQVVLVNGEAVSVDDVDAIKDAAA